MAVTPSNMLPLGTIAPAFELWDVVSQKTLRLEDLRSDQATVIFFICNHCPYVKHIQTGLLQLIADYQPRGVAFIAINSNDVERYPEDGAEPMRVLAETWGNPFPYLYDETQDVARAYQAACTPDFYLFDGNQRCVYRGQMDGARPGSFVPVTGKSLRDALDAILLGRAVSAHQIPSIGCNIKWLPGASE